MNKPTIFISSSAEGIPIAKALKAHLENDAFVKLWFEGAFSPSKSLLESLDVEASNADFAVFIITSDDSIISRSATRTSANNLFELGFFLGKIGLSRIFILAPDYPDLILPSELSGLSIARFNYSPGIDLMPALIPAANVIRTAISSLSKREERLDEFYTCFISYSNEDKEFASKLYGDLQQIGVRCWLDVKDLKIGEDWRSQIERAIEIREKVLLVLSNASVNSFWVQHEIEKALELEYTSGKTLLFPLRLDDSIFNVHNPPLERIKEKQIGDFRNWQDKKLYQRAFSRLLRGLMISTSVETKEAV